MEPLIYIIAYLIGSTPFGLVLSKIAGHGDIRAIGSGNIGATNVLRTGNKPLALLTLILDSGKGAFTVLIYKMYFFQPMQFGPCPANDLACTQGQEMTFIQHEALMILSIGLFAILGHCFPIWLKFKGGKGVSTTLGVLLAAVPLAGLAACAAWLVTAFAFRISSLAALVAMAVAPIVTFFVYGTGAAGIALLVTTLVFIRHKDNIERLRKGEEPKVGKKKEGHDESDTPSD